MTTNKPPAKAATLQYKGKKTPIVSAIGMSEQALAMLDIAKQHNIPVYQDEELINLLTQLEIGQEIPAELFEWIATILAFAFFARNEVPEGFSPLSTHNAYDKVRKTYGDGAV